MFKINLIQEGSWILLCTYNKRDNREASLLQELLSKDVRTKVAMVYSDRINGKS